MDKHSRIHTTQIHSSPHPWKTKLADSLIFLALIPLIIVMFLSELAIAKNHVTTFEHEGFIYKYEKVPVFDKKTGENKSPDWGWKGEITIIAPGGDRTYWDNTAYQPGCHGYPPISLIQPKVVHVPFTTKALANDFIVFCGNTGGRNSVIRIYDPHVGTVAALHFNAVGPVEFAPDKNGVYRVKVIYQSFINPRLGGPPLDYPVYFRLGYSGGTIAFEHRLDDYALTAYRNYIQEKLDIFIAGGYSDSGYQALLVAKIIKDKKLYCSVLDALKLRFDGKQRQQVAKFVNEINQINKPFEDSQCKEE